VLAGQVFLHHPRDCAVAGDHRYSQSGADGRNRLDRTKVGAGHEDRVENSVFHRRDDTVLDPRRNEVPDRGVISKAKRVCLDNRETFGREAISNRLSKCGHIGCK
jgi:hypothetical protein